MARLAEVLAFWLGAVRSRPFGFQPGVGLADLAEGKAQPLEHGLPAGREEIAWSFWPSRPRRSWVAPAGLSSAGSSRRSDRWRIRQSPAARPPTRAWA